MLVRIESSDAIETRENSERKQVRNIRTASVSGPCGHRRSELKGAVRQHKRSEAQTPDQTRTSKESDNAEHNDGREANWCMGREHRSRKEREKASSSMRKDTGLKCKEMDG
jgi:hypothetical protein